MKTAYLINIKGRVTGVGFRYSAAREAASYKSICGYVANISRGEVEVLIQGNESDLRSMIEWLKNGPPCARVDSIDLKELIPDPRLSTFIIK